MMTIAQARAWVEAAKSDGWTQKPAWADESMDTACLLRKDDLIAVVTIRPQGWIAPWAKDELSQMIHVQREDHTCVKVWNGSALVDAEAQYDFVALSHAVLGEVDA